MATTQQTPREEAAERVAEGLPGLTLAAQAVALGDMRRTLHENQKRIVSDDKIYRRLIGMEDLAPKEDEEMGDIAISGDHHNHYHYEAPPPAAPAVATPVAEKIKRVKRGLSGAAKAAVIAASVLGAGGLGAGALALLHGLRGDDAAATANADAGARVRVYWGDEEIKPGETKQAGVEIKGESK